MLPTVEPVRTTPSGKGNGQDARRPSQPVEKVPMQEILGDTVDPTLKASCMTVPSKHSLTVGGLPFGFVMAPFAQQDGSETWLRRNADRCMKCGAFRNLYVSVEVSSGRWACNFCEQIAHAEDLRGASGLEHKELKDAVVYYDEGGGGLKTLPLVHVFVLDTTIRQKDLQSAKADVIACMESLPPEAIVGLVAFDSVVRVFDLSCEDVGRAQILSGTESPSSAQLNALGSSGAVLTAPVYVCKSAFTNIVNSLKPPVRVVRRRQAKLRCLGPAIETAVAVSGGAQSRPPCGPGQHGVSPSGGHGRVVVCMGAEASVGPGAMPGDGEEEDDEVSETQKYFSLVGERARRLGVSVDVFVASMVGVGLPLLQRLAFGCGGDVVTHPNFGEPMRTNLIRACARGTGSGGVFDVYCSPGAAIRRIIGPLVQPHTREECEAAEELPNLSISPSVEQRNGYTVIFELDEDIPEDQYVYFQFVVAYTTLTGERLLRVSTTRLPVTSNVATLLQSANVQVAAVLMGKEAVMDVCDGVPEDKVKAHLNERLVNITKTWGDQAKVTVSGRVSVVPAQLQQLPYLTYHLLHGPLLGPILNHVDDYAAVRQLFLHSSMEDSLRMVAPYLLVCPMKEGEQYTYAPLEDLSLLPDRILMLDHHTHVFIWSGSQVKGPEFEAVRASARAHAQQWSATRFPAPEIMSFNEGDSMARWLVCRLNPSHRDSTGGGLYGAVKGFFQARFVPTDDDSMMEWMSKLRIAASMS